MKMEKLRKIAVLVMLFTFLTGSVASAEDAMDRTLKGSLYGGLIGGLIGTAVMLLTDNPDDHLEYIPTGAAVGILVGAAYGEFAKIPEALLLALQPVAAVVAGCRERGGLVHVDAAQSVGRVPFAVAGCNADLVAFTAHKLGGPKGKRLLNIS